jgi:putative acetyltransferase
MECTLRSAVSGDSGAVRELVGGVLHEYGMQIDPQGYDSDLLDVEASYIRAGGCFHVLADEQGRIVGSVGLMPKCDGVAELRKMYLAPGMRGRGLGKRMLRALLDDARRLGFRRIVLETATPMKEAQQLYMAHGFRRVEGCCASASRCDRVYQLDLLPAE